MYNSRVEKSNRDILVPDLCLNQYSHHHSKHDQLYGQELDLSLFGFGIVDSDIHSEDPGSSSIQEEINLIQQESQLSWRLSQCRMI